VYSEYTWYGIEPNVTDDVVESPTDPLTVPSPRSYVPVDKAGDTHTMPASASTSLETSGVHPLTTIVPNRQEVMDVADTELPSVKTTRVPPYVGPRCGTMEC
jgi:hypothetical protein